MNLEQLAISAWRKVWPERIDPERLEALQTENQATTIYRLIRVGQAGSPVIAKRCRQSTARIERTIYEEILPKLPLPRLHYYGFVEEPNTEFCWLFIEDASSEEKYNPHYQDHRVAAAQWLGIMNKSASGVAAATRLPERRAEHYLDLLQLARDTILSNISNPSLNPHDHALLETILAHCDYLSAHWDRLASVCQAMPHTLVHGDFIKKNVAVRFSRDGMVFLPFDWEKAGWGMPAEDISRVDIPTYWSTVRDYWPELSANSLKRLAHVGKVFRCLVFLDWIAPKLAHESTEPAMSDIRSCEGWLAGLIEAAEWQN
jgi:hypothetical protein